jgi:hypothetical protein
VILPRSSLPAIELSCSAWTVGKDDALVIGAPRQPISPDSIRSPSGLTES